MKQAAIDTLRDEPVSNRPGLGAAGATADLPLMFDAAQSAEELFRHLFVFEMANNHQGSLSHGLRIVRSMGELARRRGIRAAVKLQYRDLDTFIHPAYRRRDDVPHIQRFLSTRLTPRDLQQLIEAIREEGLTSVVTPFDESSVHLCLDHGVEILKVASCSATDWPLLEEIAGTGRPLIVSAGGLEVWDIDKLVSFLTHRQVRFALMHCIAIYPAPNESIQMCFLDKLRVRYPHVPVGYSGHEAPDNLDVVRAAVAKGAELLERHIGLAAPDAPLNAYSLDPQQADAWVATALETRVICGHPGRKLVAQDERRSLRSLQRGVFARRDLEQGELITPEDVFYAMPCLEGQTTSGAFGRYRATFVATRPYVAGEPLHEQAPADQIGYIRGIVHDVKGMLHEAHIVVTSDFEIELSHHRGLEEFRRTGAVIVNMINRTYCKKLVIVLPGQHHPAHYHRVKEETFQLLWGDLTLEVAGQVRTLRRGETVLVRPGEWHAFASRGGAIFEEISTHHEGGDSVYQDPLINQKDVLERKTILRDW